MIKGWKWLSAGLLIGVVATLLVQHFTSSDRDLPEQIAEELGCSDGVHPSTAADARHSAGGPNGFSWFSVTHAQRILGINGCDPVGPATTYLEFSDQIEMQNVLTTLNNFRAMLRRRTISLRRQAPGRPGSVSESSAKQFGGELEVLRS